jgi:HTH-type transcriptional regulator/antitoxin HigA
MVNNPLPEWRPDWAVAPGEILLETLQERGMTQSELANRIARPLKTINEIINGKASITADTAIQLERALGVSARFWTNLEAAFREQIARQEAARELEANATWIDDFPIRDLIRRKLIRKTGAKADTLAELLSYFGISSPEAFERHWVKAAAFRSSPAFAMSLKAAAAWLRWGQIEAGKIENAPAYDSRKFRRALADIRQLTRRGPFMQTVNRVKDLCLESGVIVLLTPELSGTHLSGATYWIGSRPVIQLSLRHKSNDQFWFTFFHEAGHVLESPRREFVDGADLESASTSDADELKADRFARDCLVPPKAYAAFLTAADFTAAAVRRFAETQQIAPGIVVGRLQRDGRVSRRHLNDLKKSIDWPASSS